MAPTAQVQSYAGKTRYSKLSFRLSLEIILQLILRIKISSCKAISLISSLLVQLAVKSQVSRKQHCQNR